MADPSPFSPGVTVSLAATSSTSNTALPTGAGTKFLIQNAGTVSVFWAVGGSTVTATTSSTPILAGASKVFTLDPTAGYIAGITVSTGATIYITRGEGN
jgi:hypothetical protein